MTRSIFKLAIAALLLGVVAGQAQARTEWRYFFKGGVPPYAVEVPDKAPVAQATSAKPRTTYKWRAIRLYAKRIHQR